MINVLLIHANNINYSLYSIYVRIFFFIILDTTVAYPTIPQKGQVSEGYL